MLLPLFDDVEISDPSRADEPDYRVERNLARAAEFFVAYDISRRGWDCFAVGEGLRYDLIADVRGVRRIQVKMNRRSVYRAPGSVSMSYTFGKSDNKPLGAYAGDVDLLALVAMDRMVVLYVFPDQVKVSALHIKASAFSPEASDLSWAEIAREWDPD